MKYNIISTGSKGNAIVINDLILIDCGVSFKKLKDVFKSISLVCLTHSHGDHLKLVTIRKLAEERPTLRFACGEWMVCDLVNSGVSKKQIDILRPDIVYDYGAFKLSPVKLSHNVENFGYRIFMNNEKLFYATDTGNLDGIEAKGYDLYMVEANYTDEELMERIKIKEQNGEFVYEYAVRENHLSKEQADAFIFENIKDESQYVYLHEHQEKGRFPNEHGNENAPPATCSLQRPPDEATV